MDTKAQVVKEGLGGKVMVRVMIILTKYVTKYRLRYVHVTAADLPSISHGYTAAILWIAAF